MLCGGRGRTVTQAAWYDAGLLTKIDSSALVAYCQTYARWCEAEEEIRRTGTVIKSTKGQPMVIPFLKVANIAWQQWTRMLTEFGMSPSSRSRVTVADAAKADHSRNSSRAAA
jgi:P27 family predicted phage terminase small subunit